MIITKTHLQIFMNYLTPKSGYNNVVESVKKNNLLPTIYVVKTISV